MEENMKRINLLSIMLAILFFAGCTRIPTNYPKVQSTAFKDHSATSIGKMFDQEAAKHPGKSGFNIIKKFYRKRFTFELRNSSK